jgi:hypothetical protein
MESPEIGCSFKVPAKPIHHLVLLDCLTGVPLTASTVAECLRQAIFLSRFDGQLGEMRRRIWRKHSYLEENIRCSPTQYVIGPEAHP